jgi:hypothetical protein
MIQGSGPARKVVMLLPGIFNPGGQEAPAACHAFLAWLLSQGLSQAG